MVFNKLFKRLRNAKVKDETGNTTKLINAKYKFKETLNDSISHYDLTTYYVWLFKLATGKELKITESVLYTRISPIKDIEYLSKKYHLGRLIYFIVELLYYETRNTHTKWVKPFVTQLLYKIHAEKLLDHHVLGIEGLEIQESPFVDQIFNLVSRHGFFNQVLYFNNGVASDWLPKANSGAIRYIRHYLEGFYNEVFSSDKVLVYDCDREVLKFLLEVSEFRRVEIQYGLSTIKATLKLYSQNNSFVLKFSVDDSIGSMPKVNIEPPEGIRPYLCPVFVPLLVSDKDRELDALNTLKHHSDALNLDEPTVEDLKVWFSDLWEYFNSTYTDLVYEKINHDRAIMNFDVVGKRYCIFHTDGVKFMFNTLNDKPVEAKRFIQQFFKHYQLLIENAQAVKDGYPSCYLYEQTITLLETLTNKLKDSSYPFERPDFFTSTYPDLYPQPETPTMNQSHIDFLTDLIKEKHQDGSVGKSSLISYISHLKQADVKDICLGGIYLGSDDNHYLLTDRTQSGKILGLVINDTKLMGTYRLFNEQGEDGPITLTRRLY